MEFFNQFLLNGPELKDVLISVMLAAVMGLLVSQLYRYTHRGLNYEHTFMAALVMMAPIVSIVMLYIRGDLVLSLGLIGSLSIVRFRTAIKDTRDMVFLFWVIAIGLGAGTFNWGVVVISSFIIMVLVAGLFFVRYGYSPNTDFVLVLSGRPPFKVDPAQEIIQQFSTEARLRSQDLQDDHWEVVYELRLSDPSSKSASRFLEQLKAVQGVSEASLMAPQLALPL